jgi:adenosylcobyric acid synthase
MTARTLMVMGTHSNVGKSILVTALCRIFGRAGVRVAPFKAQNIALNAGVTPEGHEIGRSTFLQAEAAGVAPRAAMNPLLIKPEGEHSQVVLEGRYFGRIDATNWQSLKPMFWSRVTACLDRLREEYDLLILEGAGSPAEINLKEWDMANMGIARHARSPVLLVGDISLGGVFAALVGTMVLLEPEERELVRGFILNKLHGDPRLLGNGTELLRERAFGVPTLGVIPFLRDVGVAAEDSAALPERSDSSAPSDDSEVTVAVVRLPYISNFDDFDPLAAEPGVALRFAGRAEELEGADAVVLPGTKSTLADLDWLRRTGIADRILRLAAAGTPVVGICGGYQMLGRTLSDPEGVEAAPGAEAAGLALLDLETTFAGTKQTRQVEAVLRASAGPFAELAGTAVRGYEIHMGRSRAADSSPFCEIGAGDDRRLDGTVGAAGAVWGTYLHGIFDNDALRHGWLRSLGWRSAGRTHDRRRAYDRLADHVESHLDMAALERILAGGR